MATKAKTQKNHARRRFQERLGINLTNELHKIIVKKIQNNEAHLVEKQSNRVSVWDVDTNGIVSSEYMDIKTIRVVYDSKSKNIVTTLFEDGPVL